MGDKILVFYCPGCGKQNVIQRSKISGDEGFVKCNKCNLLIPIRIKNGIIHALSMRE